MVAAGEDPRFIFRRMMISACEDVGLADPNAIVVVEADAAAFDRIGLPEGRFHLAHAALYLATCPKSNSTLGFFDALSDVEKEKEGEVPNHLKDANRDGKGFGHGEGYLYPHSYKDHWVAQQYLPSALQGKVYYKPSGMGYEGKIQEEVQEKREAQLEAVVEDLYQENLTFSPGDRARDKWLERAMGNRADMLLNMMRTLSGRIDMPRHGNVLVLNASHGLMLYQLMKKNPEGGSYAQVTSREQKEIIDHFSENLDQLTRPMVYVSDTFSIFDRLEEGLSFSVIGGRNILSRLSQDGLILQRIKQRLDEDGSICLMEAIPSLSSRLSSFASSELREKLEKAEEEIYSSSNPLVSWGKKELEETVRKVFPTVEIEYREVLEDRLLTPDSLLSWWSNTYSKYGIEKDEFLAAINPGTLKWKNTIALISTKGKGERIRENGLSSVHQKVKGS